VKKKKRGTRDAPGNMPEELRAVELAQLQCPKGHKLPHRTNQGTCSPVYCPGSASSGAPYKGRNVDMREKFKTMSEAGNAAKAEKSAIIKVLSAEADKVIDTMIPESVPGFEMAREAAKAQKTEELVKLGHSIGRWAAMRAFFKVPENMDAGAAEQFVEQRSASLAPDALVELERQLKLGDDSQRREAARDILDMRGMRKRDAMQGTSQPLIQIMMSPGQQPPWVQRVEAPQIPKTIVSTVVDTKKGSGNGNP
jgi:hypothetical protein